ncbi:MAG: response regulator [Myxococcota bacterium]
MARTVLVVDASPLGARRVEEALAGTGFRVVSVGSAPEAEAAVEAGDIAVVLANVTFPRGNGYDLAKLARARNPEAVVFLLYGGFEVYDAERAERAGVTGRIGRPFTVESLRRTLEGALGPLHAEPEPAPPAPPELEMLPADALQPEPEPRPESRAPAPQGAVGDERLAAFLPRDWRSYPPVSVDPAVVAPAVERAILEVLPEVLEAVLAKALLTSRPFRDLVEVAVDEAVRAQVGPIARRVIEERLREIEAQGDEPG